MDVPVMFLLCQPLEPFFRAMVSFQKASLSVHLSASRSLSVCTSVTFQHHVCLCICHLPGPCLSMYSELYAQLCSACGCSICLLQVSSRPLMRASANDLSGGFA